MLTHGLFLCAYSCGFQGAYADVAAHELTCQFAPAMTATATHELACPLAPGGIVQGPPHDEATGRELARPLARGDGGKDAGSSVAENEANDLEIAKALGEGNVAVEEEHKLSSPIRCIRWNVAAQQEQQQEVNAEVQVNAEVEAGDELGACGRHAAEEQAEAPRATSSADVGAYVRTCGTDAPKEAAEEAAEESAYASKRQHAPANASSIRQQTSAAEEARIYQAAPRTTSSSSSGLNAEQLQPAQHQHPASTPAGSTDPQQLQHRPVEQQQHRAAEQQQQRPAEQQQHRPAEQLQHRPAEQQQHRPAEQQQTAQTSSSSSGLNAEQQQAAQHPAREPLMILAGAGSGKTKTLISRMQHLKDQGIPLSKILVLTFSTAATKELTSRVAKAFRG